MTTNNNRMKSFQRMAERLAQGQKLLTTEEKLAVMAHQPSNMATPEVINNRFPKVLLVLKPGKKHVPQ